ncbi:hypothetical protein CG723_24380 [Streptomyces sp. CB01635]|uniref:hypothetical protein n=1 Tax=Streptomyces sp. CB01635 TaxID=2020326 RepID=UPI000C26F0EC|nr:hypothetical protein [Streptomyces sp. CB01635]PJN09069.1 hypothetical protein CG723_24380 [Streptomyces sp. CB01635]
MSNEPYEDEYGQQQPPQQTQHWQGQTWDTQAQSTYPPPQGSEPGQAAYGQAEYGQAAYGQGPVSQTGGEQHAYGDQQAYGGEQRAYGDQQAYGGEQHAYGGDQQSYGYGQVPYGQGPAVQTPGGQTPPPAHAAYGQAPQGPGADQQTQVFGTVAAAQPLPVAEPEAAGYGPATVTGNARVTDAQRARAEGRSPIIEPGMQPAALTALLGLLLAGGAAVGQYALLVPLVLLQAVTAAGWFRLNGMWPARQGIALAFAGGLAADAALLVTGREHAPAAILGTLGVWVLLTLVLQLRSHAAPDERMYGLMATVASAALAIVATGHLAADPDAVTVGAVAVAVAVLARALPLPTPASVAVALLAAAGAGIAAGGLTDMGSKGALLGLGAGVCALIGHRVASYDYPSRFVHMTAGVALPLAAAAPAVYLLGRVVG